MKAVYCYAMGSFFKIAPDDFKFKPKEVEHLKLGEWRQVDIPSNFDGNFTHYFLDSSDNSMQLLPFLEWPENKIVQGVF